MQRKIAQVVFVAMIGLTGFGYVWNVVGGIVKLIG